MADKMSSMLRNVSYPWLDDAACADAPLEDYFVDAGKAIKPEARERCQRCPVRRDCVIHAYTQGIGNGYFGGLSPSQRRGMSLEEALAFIETDLPEPEPDESAA